VSLKFIQCLNVSVLGSDKIASVQWTSTRPRTTGVSHFQSRRSQLGVATTTYMQITSNCTNRSLIKINIKMVYIQIKNNVHMWRLVNQGNAHVCLTEFMCFMSSMTGCFPAWYTVITLTYHPCIMVSHSAPLSGPYTA
jgi:hypothetical protein